jgi:hypothetical protein
VRLASGGLLAVNPGASLAATACAHLQPLGRVEYLLAPNHFHHLGILAWQRELGTIPVLASGAAQPRLQKRGYAPLREPSEIEALLPAAAEFLLPGGLRTGEVWLRIAIGGHDAWVVGDAFFHVPRTPRSAAGLFLRLSGTTPGLRIGATFKWGHVRDRRVYRDWLLERLEANAPTMLVPAHGDVLTDVALASRIRELITDSL